VGCLKGARTDVEAGGGGGDWKRGGRERGRERLAQANVVCSANIFFWWLQPIVGYCEDWETFVVYVYTVGVGGGGERGREPREGGVCIHSGCWGRGGERERATGGGGGGERESTARELSVSCACAQVETGVVYRAGRDCQI
jgi:hypothetical protein